MKIILNNFGPISNFEFDLEKDLHIIFGKNNIGKSYAITSVYLILKNLLYTSNRDFFNFEYLFFNRQFREANTSKNDELFKVVNDIEKNIGNKLNNNESTEIDVSEQVEYILSRVLNKIFIGKLENSFKNSFASIEGLSNKYSKKPLSIILSYNQINLIIESKQDTLIVKEVRLLKHIIVKKATTNRKPRLLPEKDVIYFNAKDNRLDLLSSCVANLYFGLRTEITSLISNVYFLPASRSGLYQALSTFSAVIAELSKSRSFLTNKIELPNISETVSDYFLNLSNIGTRPKNEFGEIIDTLENEILNGKVSFNKETKKLVFHQKEIGEDLDLSFTSSMISEIAPIVAYFKYIVSNKTANLNGINTRERQGKSYGLLFIEEPEAHLHPEIQIKLMEIFGIVINKNIKIIMTSHSNYMFNKLSNLLLDGKIEPKRVGSYLMRSTQLGSVTDTLSMKAEEDGMNDENFADIAEILYEERIRIYDRLNKK